MRRRIFRRSVLAAVLVLALVLVAFASCGRGKHRQFTGAGFDGSPQSGTGGGGNGAGTTNGIGDGSGAGIGRGNIAPPQQVTRSLAEVTAEIRAYEPPQSAGVDSSIFETLRAELLKQIEEMAQSRGVSSFPVRSVSADRDDEVGLVSDIFVVPNLDGSNNIEWNETLKGDFDGNGEVNVADITPVAVNFLATYGAGYGGADECKASDRLLLFAKGGPFTSGTNETDAATELNVSDITTIALNYLEGPPETGFWGYDVWRIPLAGGAPTRIPNPGDTDAPTVVRNAANASHNAGEMLSYSFTDMPPAAASSLHSPHSLSAPASGATFTDRMNLIFRRASGITEDGDGWSNGDYYYWIEPRGAQDGAAPADPKAPKMDVQVTYDTPFRMKAGQEVQLHITVWGDVTIQSYGVNWGDGAADSQPATTSYYIFAHTYTASGTFVPIVSVQAAVPGNPGTVIAMQEAPPVVIFDAVPLNPNNLDVSPFGGGVHLTWSAPPDWTSGDVYNVYYSLRRGDARPVFLGLTSVNSIDATITSQLPGGMSAFFKVTVKRGNLESAFSNEYKYPPTGVAPPNPLLLLGTSNDTRVDLSWSAVPDTTDYTVTGYRIYKGTELNDPAPVLASAPDPLPAAQTSYTYIPLPGEEVLYFFARTVADIGDSGRSNEVAWQVTTPPEPPINVTASAGYRWIRVNWDGSPTAGVDGYRVSYAPTDNAANIKAFDTTSDTRTFTINDDTASGGNHPVLNAKQYNLFVEAKRGTLYSTPKTAASNNPVDPENTPPTAGFVVTPTSGTTSTVFQFNASTGNPSSSDPDGAPLTFEWDWNGDGTYDLNSGNNGSPTHTYSTEAQFTPVLRVTDEENATDAFTGPTITTIPGAPTASANASPTTGNAPLDVDFNANGSNDSDGTIDEYAWQFFAGDTWHDYTPQLGVAVHTYTQPGSFTATLRVTDNDSNKAYDSVGITVDSVPTAVANANPASGTKPLTVNFDADGSTDIGGTIVKWEWDWTNDGTYDYSSNTTGTTSHVYDTAGDYTAQLRVTDDYDATDTDTVPIHVNAPPVAVLTANPTEGDPPLTVNFDASGSYDPDGNIVKYEWDWDGDGTYDYDSGATATAQHVYDTGADFTATVRITDGDGATATDGVLIRTYRWFTETVETGGSVGWYTSLALDSTDAPQISYFDYTNNDLKYAYFGVSTWITSIVINTISISWSTSIAVDSLNYPHISYLYEADNELKYASWSGATWQVDTADSNGNVGRYSSVALDSSDHPHISYYDYGNNDLKYAYYNGFSWDTATVDSAGNVGDYTSIALDSSERPHISYHSGSNTLKYAHFDGTSWQVEIVDGPIDDVGVYTSIAIDSSDNPHISYKDETNKALKYAYYNGLLWQKETIDSIQAAGGYTSIAVDANDYPHISYFDNDALGELKYAYFDGASWHLTTVDSTSGNNGKYTSLELDSNDRPHISYFDQNNANLKYAWYGLPR